MGVEDKKIEKFYAKCFKIAQGYPEHITQDFPAWAVEQYLKRGRVKLEWLFIDYLRLIGGRPGNGSNELHERRKELQFSPLQFDDGIHARGDEFSTPCDRTIDGFIKNERINNAAKKLTTSEKVVFF